MAWSGRHGGGDSGNGAAFEVEFSDRNGRRYATLGLRPDQLMVLRYEPAALNA